MNISSTDLKQVIVFQRATDEELQLILKNSIVRTMEENGFFFFQGDSANYLYVLVSGRAKLLQASPQGQQVSLRII